MKGNKYNTITKARKVTATHRIRAHVSLQTFQVCKALHHGRKYVGWQVRVQCLFVRDRKPSFRPVCIVFTYLWKHYSSIETYEKVSKQSMKNILSQFWKVKKSNYICERRSDGARTLPQCINWSILLSIILNRSLVMKQTKFIAAVFTFKFAPATPRMIEFIDR